MMLSPQVRDRILVQRSGEIIRRRAAGGVPGTRRTAVAIGFRSAALVAPD
jgi:hypothetical protein